MIRGESLRCRQPRALLPIDCKTGCYSPGDTRDVSVFSERSDDKDDKVKRRGFLGNGREGLVAFTIADNLVLPRPFSPSLFLAFSLSLAQKKYLFLHHEERRGQVFLRPLTRARIEVDPLRA